MSQYHMTRGCAALLTILISFVLYTEAAARAGEEKVVSYSIESVFCSGCVGGLRGVILEIDGVVSVEVDVEGHQLQIVFETDTTDVESLQARITEETTFKLRFLSVEKAGSDES